MGIVMHHEINFEFMKILFRSFLLPVMVVSVLTGLYGQTTSENSDLNYRKPVDIPMNLSGNFGEFRNNHFHTGIDIRTIVSGIAESFTPEEVVGKKVTVLINLAPRSLRGVESQGMILMTETTEGQLVFVNPEGKEPDNGLKIS